MELFTSTDGTAIAAVKSGAGPPLVLVHGTTADHTRWSGVSPQLEEHFTVCAVDRRGRGESGDTGAYSIQREAEDIAAVVEAIEGTVAVLAHSYGAVCSLEAALLTDGIHKMVLYEPPIPTGLDMYPPGVPDLMQELIDDDDPEGALELFFKSVVGMPEHEFDEYRQLPMWSRRVELAHTIPRELAIDKHYSFDPTKFADLDVPTLLLLGGDSPPMFRRAVEAVDAALPDSRVVTLAGQQHIAMDTNPELFLDEVLLFLRE